MFDLETFRNLNDELKYELYKDLIENVTFFKRIIENLTVSTKDEEKGNKFIDLENLKTRAIGKLQKTNLKLNGASLKLGAEIRTNEAKITKKARITKKSKYKQPIFKKKNSTNYENIYCYHEKENILVYYWETPLLTESIGNKYRKMCWREDLVGTQFLHCWNV